jgi:hypothetical protein
MVKRHIKLMPYKTALNRPLEEVPGHMPLLHVLLEYMKGSMCQCLVIKYALTTFLPYISGYVDEFLQSYLFIPARVCPQVDHVAPPMLQPSERGRRWIMLSPGGSCSEP